VVIDLDQIQEAQQDWGNTILLHTFHYEMIHGSTCSQVPLALPQALGSGAFLTPGSRMVKKSGSGSGMNNQDHISESLETFFWAKILIL
jgi:hypothetical protein